MVPAELRAAATDELRAPLIRLEPGSWHADVPAHGAGILVLTGLMIRRVGIDGRYGAELLGAGDLLRPWQGLEISSLEHATDWQVLTRSRLAAIDERVTRRLARYPQLSVALIDRALARAHTLAATMAIVHQPQLETRLQMLLWLLADRWGRVGPAGTLVPLSLTHEVLAALVAARRPTVSTALSSLARRGLVTRSPSGFLLHGDPPGELRELAV